ncbi:hypothetical protein CRG98_030739 [Punica granatum]|uniref:Uncharacterized protein n=1 Tax=Punica granatum TaxID=22663 RepID=A0A2I0IY27_PUNGR|nr:hypothetical protein CRG98_030739 [Punica granatum]
MNGSTSRNFEETKSWTNSATKGLATSGRSSVAIKDKLPSFQSTQGAAASALTVTQVKEPSDQSARVVATISVIVTKGKLLSSKSARGMAASPVTVAKQKQLSGQSTRVLRWIRVLHPKKPRTLTRMQKRHEQRRRKVERREAGQSSKSHATKGLQVKCQPDLESSSKEKANVKAKEASATKFKFDERGTKSTITFVTIVVHLDGFVLKLPPEVMTVKQMEQCQVSTDPAFYMSWPIL